MRRMSIVAITCLTVILSACAGMVREISPTEFNGESAYNVYTVYGPLDGTVDDAREVLAREATKPCPGGYKKVKELDIPRTTAWGSPNGQRDLTWTITCE